MKRIFILLLVCCLLSGCGILEQIAAPTESSQATTAPTEAPKPTESAPPPTQIKTGWVTESGKTYYIKSNGTKARGKVSIDGIDYFFDKNGVQVLVVNPWNFVPYDYSPDLVTFYDFAQYEDGNVLDKTCLDPLLQMLTDCRRAGHEVRIVSSYRRQITQENLYNNKVDYFLNQGYDLARAREEAGKIIAVPGTSEHQLGLAVDLIDKSYPYLDEGQEKTPAQKWLMAHCWDYGFILRYPNGKTEHTGIIYEPWHYRYVGKELALELKNSGLCLEEYFETLQ